jgi:hypothetical protein
MFKEIMADNFRKLVIVTSPQNQEAQLILVGLHPSPALTN